MFFHSHPFLGCRQLIVKWAIGKTNYLFVWVQYSLIFSKGGLSQKNLFFPRALYSENDNTKTKKKWQEPQMVSF